MPFSTLKDPVDLARAQGALEAVWTMVKGGIAEADFDRERSRLGYIVASFVHVAFDEEDLTRRALARFRKKDG